MNTHKFNDVLNEILELRKYSYKSLGTYLWEVKISKKIVNYFESYNIEDVNISVLTHFFNKIRYKKDGTLYSEKYMKEIKSLVNATLKQGIICNYINVNPFDLGFKMPFCKKYKPTARIVSNKDLEKLFKVLHTNKRFEVVIPILLLTGMRIGELCALKWTDIDFNNNIIHINNATSRLYSEKDGEIINNGYHILDTKTEASVRDLPVCDTVLELLMRWKNHIRVYPNLSNMIIENKTENIIFVNYHGKVMNYDTLYKSLMDFLRKYDLQHCGILFHKLRHCYATHMLDSGVDINVISKLLGHINVSTTCNIYIKVNLQPKVQAVKCHSNYIENLHIIE
ncbi:site-specific integrase [Paludicola sp. MB14-C6]|uniref:tyrosine-type recombinase/integrase n=1 Tax=Paludihabitans sp. MB14-C6 TaxID=3070656 RepID=UPI0027DD4514|nr:site-specific integrase [Paludicola sp. MB14-C6]WMJ22715.1 site-specific integrase [Paludicola sp. MB14-C6]